MHWYLVHSKPRQEARALENLQRQGYDAFWPTVPVESVRQGRRVTQPQALFPRYLFVRLGQDRGAQAWAPVRSTLGVSRLVSFGTEPARVPDELVQTLQRQTRDLADHPQPLFSPGQSVRITQGPFVGLEAIYHQPDGDARVIVLLDILSKTVAVPLAVGQVRAVG